MNGKDQQEIKNLLQKNRDIYGQANMRFYCTICKKNGHTAKFCRLNNKKAFITEKPECEFCIGDHETDRCLALHYDEPLNPMSFITRARERNLNKEAVNEITDNMRKINIIKSRNILEQVKNKEYLSKQDNNKSDYTEDESDSSYYNTDSDSTTYESYNSEEEDSYNSSDNNNEDYYSEQNYYDEEIQDSNNDSSYSYMHVIEQKKLFLQYNNTYLKLKIYLETSIKKLERALEKYRKELFNKHNSDPLVNFRYLHPTIFKYFTFEKNLDTVAYYNEEQCYSKIQLYNIIHTILFNEFVISTNIKYHWINESIVKQWRINTLEIKYKRFRVLCMIITHHLDQLIKYEKDQNDKSEPIIKFLETLKKQETYKLLLKLLWKILKYFKIYNVPILERKKKYIRPINIPIYIVKYLIKHNYHTAILKYQEKKIIKKVNKELQLGDLTELPGNPHVEYVINWIKSRNIRAKELLKDEAILYHYLATNILYNIRISEDIKEQERIIQKHFNKISTNEYLYFSIMKKLAYLSNRTIDIKKLALCVGLTYAEQPQMFLPDEELNSYFDVPMFVLRIIFKYFQVTTRKPAVAREANKFAKYNSEVIRKMDLLLQRKITEYEKEYAETAKINRNDFELDEKEDYEEEEETDYESEEDSFDEVKHMEDNSKIREEIYAVGIFTKKEQSKEKNQIQNMIYDTKDFREEDKLNHNKNQDQNKEINLNQEQKENIIHGKIITGEGTTLNEKDIKDSQNLLKGISESDIKNWDISTDIVLQGYNKWLKDVIIQKKDAKINEMKNSNNLRPQPKSKPTSDRQKKIVTQEIIRLEEKGIINIQAHSNRQLIRLSELDVKVIETDDDETDYEESYEESESNETNSENEEEEKFDNYSNEELKTHRMSYDFNPRYNSIRDNKSIIKKDDYVIAKINTNNHEEICYTGPYKVILIRTQKCILKQISNSRDLIVKDIKDLRRIQRIPDFNPILSKKNEPIPSLKDELEEVFKIKQNQVNSSKYSKRLNKNNSSKTLDEQKSVSMNWNSSINKKDLNNKKDLKLKTNQHFLDKLNTYKLYQQMALAAVIMVIVLVVVRKF